MKFTIILTGLLSLGLLTGCAGSDDSTSNTSVPAPQKTASSTPTTPTNADPLARGAKLYKRCQTCHTLEDGGRHKVGPNLWAVFGSTAGTREGFAYSSAMSESGVIWNMETLSGYIENPRDYMPGNRMSYAGLRKAEDREAILAFMQRETQPK